MAAKAMARSLSSRLPFFYCLPLPPLKPKPPSLSARRLLSTHPPEPNLEIRRALTTCLLDMCCALRNDGFALEASEIFPVIYPTDYKKPSGMLPWVVLETALISGLLDKGMPHKAIQAYTNMTVKPNSYTYTVLIKGLAKDGKMLEEATIFLMEMIKKGMRPNADTCVALLLGHVKVGKREMVEVGDQFREMGFLAVRGRNRGFYWYGIYKVVDRDI